MDWKYGSSGRVVEHLLGKHELQSHKKKKKKKKKKNPGLRRLTTGSCSGRSQAHVNFFSCPCLQKANKKEMVTGTSTEAKQVTEEDNTLNDK
jgi:hypothetical protein